MHYALCLLSRSKTGVEKRLRDEIPHLLDVDGDLVHHVHNAAKVLCTTFAHDKKVSGFCRSISTDSDWIRPINDGIETICSLLELKYTKPPNYADHRFVFCLLA